VAGDALRNGASQVCAATHSMAHSSAGDVGRGLVGCNTDCLRKMWVNTYGEAGWKRAVVGLVKYRSNKSHARIGGIMLLAWGSRGRRTGYLTPVEKAGLGGEGRESQDGDESSGEWPPRNPDRGDAAF